MNQPARPEPEHQLRALRQMRPRHPEWPLDEAACLADAHIRRLTYGLALNYARAPVAAAAPAPTHTAAQHRPRVPKLNFDPRRAAANDHDED